MSDEPGGVGSRAAEFSVSSRLDAPSGSVWDRVTTFEGVNDELMPIMRMTAPRHVRSIDTGSVVLGERLCRSWVLLFGLIPFDYDDVTLVRLDPGRGFLERSPMLSQRFWEHERTIEPAGEDGCVLTDRICFEPRLPLPGPMLRPLLRRIFRHRHRRLRRRFGGELVWTR